MKLITKFFIFGLLLILIVFLGMSYSHEVVHTQNFAYFGVDSHIEILSPLALSKNAFMVTVPNTAQYQSLTNEQKNSLYKLNSKNEAIGYTITCGVTGIMTLLLLGFIILLKKRG